MRIPFRLIRTLVARGIILWILARLAAGVGLAMTASFGDGGPAPAALVPLWSIALCSALVLVDLHRRKELMFLHNIGVGTGVAVSLATIPAAGAELILLALPR